MKSLRVTYNDDTGAIETIETASTEVWEEVCERFDNDVRRVRKVSGQKGFNTLFVCYDENNKQEYYLVEVNETLRKLRQKTFLKKLGRDTAKQRS